MFSQSVIEKIDYYVYFLQHPVSGDVFYVGKGNGNRVFSHLQCAIDSNEETEKLDIIRSITTSGLKPNYFILRHGLTEQIAFEIEASLIDFIGMKNLSNLQSGHYSSDYGIKTAEELSAMYEATELVTDIPIILININRLYDRAMTDAELYEATRKSWVIGPRKEKALFVVATYRGLTREVYKIENWFPVDVAGKVRWGFNGSIAAEEIRSRLRYKSIASFFTRGAANPIKYVNC